MEIVAPLTDESDKKQEIDDEDEDKEEEDKED